MACCGSLACFWVLGKTLRGTGQQGICVCWRPFRDLPAPTEQPTTPQQNSNSLNPFFLCSKYALGFLWRESCKAAITRLALAPCFSLHDLGQMHVIITTVISNRTLATSPHNNAHARTIYRKSPIPQPCVTHTHNVFPGDKVCLSERGWAMAPYSDSPEKVGYEKRRGWYI